MAVKIRLKRIGNKNRPVYRVVAADARSPRDGKCIEELGLYHPLQAKDNVQLNMERIDYWLSQGAQPSDTVFGFIKKARRAAASAVEEADPVEAA